MTELDVDAVVARANEAARARWGADTSIGELTPLPGGVSSLTYRADLSRPGCSAQPIVVKVAPPGLAPVRNRDVLRQARIIALLDARPEISMPSVLFEDAGDPPLFAMSLMRGESYEPLLDISEKPPSPDVVAPRALAAARQLAAMHSFGPEELGVGDEQSLALPDELDRWAALFATVDDSVCSGHTDVLELLRRSIPEPVADKLVHGDYRLANMLFDGTELTAVIDWEIWSVGDPRTDIAWLLMHTDPAHVFHESRSAADEAAGAAMPSRVEIADAYARAAGADNLLESIDWFLAYCLYKTASTISVLVKRNRRRESPDPTLEVAARHLPDVIERARSLAPKG
ncbi:phosphotransferase family protein [Rhodococcoides kyotonense]|uniref:phosphotransferase family protein n=1 Tax=Rhodococcoides kyotonense TaxID=398843 RepID=UPI000B777BA8|nr:phosphotransferase family protein [Rhodococcus kyotonensis]